jgi:hypothetical protein
MTPPTLPNLVAFTGYSRSGKDEAAKALLPLGYRRHNFGDIIKQQLRDVVWQHMGINTYTEADEFKTRIRGLLEQWGEANYENILATYLANIPAKAVNTRLCRVREAREWKNRGGVLVCVVRPDVPASTQWEVERMEELKEAGVIDGHIVNHNTVARLHEGVIQHLHVLTENIGKQRGYWTTGSDGWYAPKPVAPKPDDHMAGDDCLAEVSHF